MVAPLTSDSPPNTSSRTLTFEIEPRGPFSLELTAWALRRRAKNTLDRWDGTTYRRALVVDGAAVDVAVSRPAHPDSARLEVAVPGGVAAMQVPITEMLERLLGVQIDLGDFYRFADTSGPLAELVDRFQGVKPPRFATLFEGLANAIACQQLSLEVGIGLLNGLARTYGTPVGDPADGVFTFPAPWALAGSDPTVLRAMGFSRQKADALIGLAEHIVDGQLRMDELSAVDNATAGEILRRQRGIGRWSAEYVLLRTLGRVDVFPGDDVGARNKLQRWLDIATPPSYDEIQAALARWQPFAGLVYFHLLLDGLGESGVLA